MHMIRTILVLCCVGLAGAAEQNAAMVRVDHAPTIDGAGDDWADIKAEQQIGDGRSTVATFKLAWDDTALYALFTVKDESPLKNGTTTLPELFKGGDVVALCFGKLGGHGLEQRILAGPYAGGLTTVAMRRQWPEKKPYRYYTPAAGEVIYEHVAPLAGAQIAAKAAKGGYILELALPWKSLDLSPRAGLETPFDAEVILSNPSGSANATNLWWRSVGGGATMIWDIATEARIYPEKWGKARLYSLDPGPRRAAVATTKAATAGVPITFDLAKPAQVSAVVMDENDWIVAEPLRCEPYPAGHHVFQWDGRDRLGLPLPAGKYHWLLGSFDGIKTEFRASVGNSGRPGYRTADGLGSCGGIHVGPSVVAADATGVYLLSSGAEGQDPMRKIDPVTGRSKWFANTGLFGGGEAIVADGKTVWMVISDTSSNTRIMRLDAATGKPAPFPGHKDKAYEIGLGNRHVSAMTLVGGRIYISNYGKILVFDDATGNELPAIAVPDCLGISRLDDKTLLVCVGSKVLRLDIASGKTQPVIEGLVEPRIATVGADGSVYVAERGASQQIRRFSSPNKGAPKQIGVFGKPGGRAKAVPTYDPLEFLNVNDMVVDAQGNLWAVEIGCAPRRFIKLTADGKHIEDFYGPTGYVTFGIDANDPTGITYQAAQDNLSFTQVRVDYAQYRKSHEEPQKAWHVEAIHYLSQNGIDDSAQPDLVSASMKGGYGRVQIFTGTNGIRYLFRGGNTKYACLFRWDGKRWIAAATVLGSPWDDKGVPYWSDANGDGLVQDAECVKAEVSGWWTWIDPDLTLHGFFADLKPAKIDERGVPTYANGPLKQVWKDPRSPFYYYGDQENYGAIFGPPTEDGGRIMLVNAGAEADQDAWDRASETRLIRVGPDGLVRSIIGHHDATMQHDGDNTMLLNVTGEMDGVAVCCDVNSTFTAYTNDGLTLGWINRDPAGRVAQFGPNAVYMESVQYGMLLKDPKSGERWLGFSSTEDVRVIAIDGIWGDQITRQRGKIEIPGSQPRAPEPPAGHCLVPASTWSTTQGTRFLGVDAYDTEWDRAVPAIAIRDGKETVAEVRLRRDAGRLCVMAEILDAGPYPAFVAENTPVFGVGPAVELLIAPALPDPKAPGAGTRIVLSAHKRADGSLVGIAYACRPGTKPWVPSADMRPLNMRGELDGPVPSTDPIDWSRELKPIPGVQVAVRQRFDRKGWRLEAEIPFGMLPEVAQPGNALVKRQMGVRESRVELDLTGPFRCNAAVWQSSAGKLRRVAWMPDGFAGTDPAVIAPATWGLANDTVNLSWSEVDKASSYRLYRAASPDPLAATLVKQIDGDTSATDLPGLGQSWYWLAPCGPQGEGQWFGPQAVHDTIVDFAPCSYLPPLDAAALAKTTLEVFPGHTRTLNVSGFAKLEVKVPAGVAAKAVKREDGQWMVGVTPSGQVEATAAITLTDAGTKKAVNLPLSSTLVPVTAHGVLCDALTNVSGRDDLGKMAVIAVDSKAPADGAAGKPAATVRLFGRGGLSERSIGRHGFILFDYLGDLNHRREIKAPFVDTFTAIGGDDYGSYGCLQLALDGKPGLDGQGHARYMRVNGRDPGAQLTLRVQATDTQPHLLSVMSNKRANWQGAPARWSVTDPATKRQWVLREFDGDQGVSIIQFRFIGTIDLTATVTAPSDDRENGVGLTSLFFD